MTREQAKKWLPILEAFSNGDNVQLKCSDKWETFEDLSFTADWECYRIKAEPKFRAWKCGEFKSLPCTLRQAYHGEIAWYFQVLVIRHDGLHISDGSDSKTISWGELFNSYEHSTDGGKNWLPCGILEQ